MRVIEPDAFLSEAEVLKRWPMLSRTELRRARKANPPKIEFYDFRKKAGGPCYTVEQVQRYIDKTYLRASPCPDTKNGDRSSHDLSLADITSTVPTTIGEGTGTLSGMTPGLASSRPKPWRARF
jgi:hypothetical protein